MFTWSQRHLLRRKINPKKIIRKKTMRSSQHNILVDRKQLKKRREMIGRRREEGEEMGGRKELRRR